MGWQITPDGAIFIPMALGAAAVLSVLAFAWHNLATMVILWFTDRAAYRARDAEMRKDWDERDGW